MVQLYVETRCIIYNSIQGIGILYEPPLHHFQFDYGIDRKNKNQTIKLKDTNEKVPHFLFYFTILIYILILVCLLALPW